MNDSLLLFDAHTHNPVSSNKAIYQADILSDFTKTSLFSCGFHPELSSLLTEEKINKLENNAQNKNCVAIGEIGLDNRYDVSFDIQEQNFIAQLQIAAKLNLPVLLHCVNSWDRCRFLHEKYAPNTFLVYHGFTKSKIIESVLDYKNAVISIGQAGLSNTPLRAAIEKIPLKRLLLETDTANFEMIELYQSVANLKSVSLPDFCAQIYANAEQIFGNDKLAGTY